MRLEVVGSSYDAATEAFADARTAAGAILDQLATGLSRTGGMSGDDATSRDFAATYDEAAAQSVAAVGDLVTALDAMARLTDASAGRHRDAESRATLGAGRAAEALATLRPQVAVPEPSAPPSTLGADNVHLPHLWNLVVDHLQGWSWPGADTDRLRVTAGLWAAIGTRITGLTHYLAAAEAELAGQRSPEIPLALEASADLRRQCERLGQQCEQLAHACRDYAEQVDQTRATVIDLLEQLAIELAATAAISAAASLITFGGGAVVGAATARIVLVARRIEHALEALRVFRAVGTAARTLPEIRGVRSALAKYRAVRDIRLAGHGPGISTFSPGREKGVDAVQRNVARHWADHRPDFTHLSGPEDYLRTAQRFLHDPPPGTYSRVRSWDGSVVRYHPADNILATMGRDGTPKTFFKPDPAVHGRGSNWDYFLDQPPLPKGK